MSGCLPTVDPCKCLCHGQLLLSDPPKSASDFCRNCNCHEKKNYAITETLSLCKHLVPVKFGTCTFCKEEEPVSPLIQQMQKLEERIKESEEKIKMLENSEIQHFKNYRNWIIELEEEMEIYGNCQNSQENRITHNTDRIQKCFDKIEELEKWNCRATPDYEAIINKINSRIEELELLTNAIEDSYNSICAPSLRKEPYKCPVCDGKRRELNIMPNGGYFESECNGCQGKGIVWG